MNAFWRLVHQKIKGIVGRMLLCSPRVMLLGDFTARKGNWGKIQKRAAPIIKRLMKKKK